MGHSQWIHNGDSPHLCACAQSNVTVKRNELTHTQTQSPARLFIHPLIQQKYILILAPCSCCCSISVSVEALVRWHTRWARRRAKNKIKEKKNRNLKIGRKKRCVSSLKKLKPIRKYLHTYIKYNRHPQQQQQQQQPPP